MRNHCAFQWALARKSGSEAQPSPKIIGQFEPMRGIKGVARLWKPASVIVKNFVHLCHFDSSLSLAASGASQYH